MRDPINIFWFRRDLRLNDNHGFYKALNGGLPVLPIFIFDSDILDGLGDRSDRRVSFIHHTVGALKQELEAHGSSLLVMHGTPLEAFEHICNSYAVAGVFANHDYEPYATARDSAIGAFLSTRGIVFKTFKDQVIFEKSEVVKPDGTPYTIFTPYSRTWLRRFEMEPPGDFPSGLFLNRLLKSEPFAFPSLAELGFRENNSIIPAPRIDEYSLRYYEETRNHPGIEGTSFAGIHLRFGTISVRRLATLGAMYSAAWLNEIIWREFFMMILHHFPRVVFENFNRKFDGLVWRNDEGDFEKWKSGETGYPMVDAGMRQLNATGWMHNRVRMLVANFLTKHLLIDWRWGEAYFAEKLLDYELSSNNGNWQWAAGTGSDAAPYFRIFNPDLQQKKFDPEFRYISKWIPGYHPGYLPKMVDQEFARKRALEAFSNLVV